MPFSIPYVMVKNVEKKQEMLVDYSKNPCPNELSDFLKCVTNKQITTTIDCKKHYKLMRDFIIYTQSWTVLRMG